jgi:hypothetical protein
MDARPARPLPRRELSCLAGLAAIAHPQGRLPIADLRGAAGRLRYQADPLARIGPANELGKELQP